MEYNSQKELLEMAEYGRNVQELVNQCKMIEDPGYRQAFAERIITLMHQMNPQNKSIDEYLPKLWKHLYRIADYELDVEPTIGERSLPEDKLKRPKKLDYPSGAARFRHYGHNVQKLINKALSIENEEVREGFVNAIGSYMKLAFRTWNREHYVSDEAIIADLETMSKGALDIDEDSTFNNLTNSIKPSNNNDRHRGRKDHKGRRNNNKKGKKYRK
jgi:hypothetical protein